MVLRVWCAAALLVIGIQQPGQKEESLQELFRSIFREAPPKRTGRNGYEELTAANKLLMQSELHRQAQNVDATLTAKRRALADPPVIKALALIRQGLRKPVQILEPDEIESLAFPKLAVCRNLARALALEQYVRLADGNVGGAIDDLLDGLRLGQTLKYPSISVGLVRVSVNAILLEGMGRHLGQLSARDCERLVALSNEWLTLQEPDLSVLDTDEMDWIKMLRDLEKDPVSLLGALILTTGEEEQVEPERQVVHDEVAHYLKQNPGNLHILMTQTIDYGKTWLEEQRANLKKPYWERTGRLPVKRDTLPARVAASLYLDHSFERMFDRFTESGVKVQLLGIHAAIRRYRWEHDRLPENLAVLHLGRLEADPFTGQSILYKRIDDTTYELYSAGPWIRDDEDRPSNERNPVHLPRRRK